MDERLKKANELRKDLKSKLKKLDQVSNTQSARNSMARRRRDEAEIFIPQLSDEDKKLRDELEADPERWLKFMFPEQLYLPFGDVHKTLINEIVRRSKTTGNIALAAPRGEGKSSITIYTVIYLIAARLSRFPVIIASSNTLARGLYEEVRHAIETNEQLHRLYPQITHPVRSLEGSAQKANKQHVNGTRTMLKWDTTTFSLADIEGSPYSNVTMRYFGLDSSIRGVRSRNSERPDLVIVDDPESEASACSVSEIEKRKKLLTRGVAGLGGPNKSLSVIVITTLQNDYSLSSQVTDPKTFPSFNGKRFSVVKEFPKNEELWQEYVEIRKLGQQRGDNEGKEANKYYEENKEAMDEGVVVSNPHRFNPSTESSTIQSAYNFISDYGYPSFMSELQNQPIPEQDVENIGLTPAIIQSRLHFDRQGIVPLGTTHVTMGIDIGKYASHWVAIAWDATICSGKIFDYGVVESHLAMDDEQSVELSIRNMLLRFSESVVNVMERKPDAIMVDTGNWTKVLYKTIVELGSPYFATKGWGQRPAMFADRKATKERPMNGNNWNASIQPSGIILYNVNADYWKLQAQTRFVTRTFDESNSAVPGSLSLFASKDKRRHHTFSYHITAEKWEEKFIEGKGLVKKWNIVRKNNHFLDATTYGVAASEMLGVSLSNLSLENTGENNVRNA